ncbi:MAG: RES family NAD+ phosphorylase [Chloroflexota bacterium]
MTGRRPSDPPALPPPGTNWPLPWIVVDAGTPLYRLTRLDFPDPAYFGRGTLFRFDAPDRSFSVCYLGTSLDCCMVEVLTPAFRPAHSPPLIVTRVQLTSYYAAIATASRPLRLAHLADEGLVRLGIDQRHSGGDDYELSRAWSLAIHIHVAAVDGIFYPSRHHNGLYCVALFVRAASAVTFRRWGALGDHRVPDLWSETARVLDRFDAAIM